MDGGIRRLSLPGFRPGPGFRRRTVTVDPGSTHPYEAAEWQGAFVIIESGVLDLEGVAGGRYRVAGGDVLWLAGLPLRALHNPGDEQAVLVAVFRRTDGPAEDTGTG